MRGEVNTISTERESDQYSLVSLRPIEVTEYASLRDLEYTDVSRIVELLAVALKGA